MTLNDRIADSAYTERYMGLPNVTDNYKGYEESDVSKMAENFRDKMLFLIHGTADDNVHFQHSISLIKALASKGVLFRQQVSKNISCENFSLIYAKTLNL